MDHAEAHERLADLALEPRALLALEHRGSPAAEALRAHIASCPTCTAEVRAWSETHEAVLAAFADAAAQGSAIPADDQPIALPPGLRGSVTRAVAAERVGGIPVAVAGSGRGTRQARFGWISGGRRPWLALAAALVLAVVGSSVIAIQQASQVVTARAESAEFARLVQATETILADPGHTSATLTAADGSSGGLVAWTDADAIVLATHLDAPAAGLVYRCWVEKGGTRAPVGEILFRQGIGYWWQRPNQAGSASLWNGGSLIVTLGPVGGPGGPALLTAPLPG